MIYSSHGNLSSIYKILLLHYVSNVYNRNLVSWTMGLGVERRRCHFST